MSGVVVVLLFLITGMSKGVCDSINAHDGFKHWGYWWSKDSWRTLYDDDHTLWEKVYNGAFNAWHVFDLVRIICPFIALWIGADIFVLMACVPAHWLGFILVYEKNKK